MTKEIPLTHGRGVALVDDEDYDRLIKRRWCNSHGYAVSGIRTGRRTTIIYMHREINGTPEGMQTDHINGNRLDNRRCNLRSCSNAQNQQNRRAATKSSKYKGVSWDGKRSRWAAYVKTRGRITHLGRFDTEEEAARAYDAAAKQMFGEFTRLNFPQESGQ